MYMYFERNSFIIIIIFLMKYTTCIWVVCEKHNAAMESQGSNMWMLFYARQHEIAGI